MKATAVIFGDGQEFYWSICLKSERERERAK